MRTTYILIILATSLYFLHPALYAQKSYDEEIQTVQFALIDGNASESYRLAANLVDNFPDSSQAWYTKSQVERKFMQYRNALVSIKNALIISPGKISYMYHTAQLHYELNNYTSCLSYCDSIITIDSLHRFSHILKAQSLYKGGYTKEALAQYLLLHNLDSTNTTFIKQIGSINTKLDSLKEAIDWYTKATRIDSADIGSYTHLGNLFVRTEQYEEGLPVLSRAIEIDSLNSWLYRFRGSLNIMGANFEEAEDDFKNAMMLGDSTVFTFRHLGLSLFKQSEYKEALPIYQTTIKLDPEDSQAWYYLGFCYKWQENIEKAKACMEKALEFSVTPSISNVYSGLAQFSALERDYEQALHYYSRAYEWDEDDAAPLAQMGMLVEQMGGKKEHAKTYYKSFIEKAEQKDMILVAYVSKRLKIINEKLFMEGKLERDE